MHDTALSSGQQAIAALRMRGALQADRVTVAPEDVWLPPSGGPVPIHDWDVAEPSFLARLGRALLTAMLAGAGFLLAFCLPF